MSLLEILKNTVDLQGWATQGRGQEGLWDPRSYYPADRGPEHPLPSGANPSLFREEFPRAVRDLSPLVSARGAQNPGYLSARVGTCRGDTVLRTWRLHHRST